MTTIATMSSWPITPSTARVLMPASVNSSARRLGNRLLEAG